MDNNNQSEETKREHTVLVTGGNGFVASHCILQLLKQGYKVRTTVRTSVKSNDVRAMMTYGGLASSDRLGFIEADLSSDVHWAEAARGCRYVLHVASPIFLRLPKHPDEMIRPAVDGTLRVLKAARDAGVERVVLTSSFGAVGYSHKNPDTLITEEDWTDPSDPSLSAYLRSKTLAERAAWDFVSANPGMELTVINPMAIFGPALGPQLSSGFELLKKILDGSMKSMPRIDLGIVDVRDLADLHIKAMTEPDAAGERFLALAGGVMSLRQIALLYKDKLGDRATQVSTRAVPDWLVRLVAIFNPAARAIVPQLGRIRYASNEKARTILNWSPRTNEEAVLATAESLFNFNNVNLTS